MTTMEAQYSPLDLLRGHCLRVEERPGLTLFRLAPTYPRARIAGVFLVLALYWSLRDWLPAELGQWEFLFVVAAIWLLLANWNKGAVVLAVVENDGLAAGEFPKALPRQTIAVNLVQTIEVRENLWRGRDIVPLCQIYLHRTDSRAPILIYQLGRTHGKRVVELATRLAERWEVRLRVDDAS